MMELTLAQKEDVLVLLEEGNNLHKICRYLFLDIQNLTMEDVTEEIVRKYKNIQHDLEVAILSSVFKETRECWHKWRMLLRGEVEKKINWKDLREKVIERDLRCVISKKEKGLVVHHINGLYTHNDIDNLISLFAGVHKVIHGGFELDDLLYLPEEKIKRSLICYEQNGTSIRHGFVYDWTMAYVTWLRNNTYPTAGFKLDVDGLWRIFMTDGYVKESWVSDGVNYLDGWMERLSIQVSYLMSIQGVSKNKRKALKKKMSEFDMRVYVEEHKGLYKRRKIKNK